MQTTASITDTHLLVRASYSLSSKVATLAVENGREPLPDTPAPPTVSGSSALGPRPPGTSAPQGVRGCSLTPSSRDTLMAHSEVRLTTPSCAKTSGVFSHTWGQYLPRLLEVGSAGGSHP